ncbi:MAG: hypothetical protein AAGJ35_06015, partial [Myxococcota bacterium]
PCAHTETQEQEAIEALAMILASVLGFSSIMRIGAVDLECSFLFDRFLLLCFCVGTWFHPVWLYPTLIGATALQNITSRWRLSPGYSNLLGFEFTRFSACALIVGLVVICLHSLPQPKFPYLRHPQPQTLAFALLVAAQSMYYASQAIGKMALARPFDWVRYNRLECLLVNAYLRGWLAKRCSLERVLKLAQICCKWRVWLCAGVLLLELSTLFLLMHPTFAALCYLGLFGFHLSVFLLTGLLAWQFMVNHVVLCILLLKLPAPLPQAFGYSFTVASICACICTWLWLYHLRTRVLRQVEHDPTSVQQAMRLADPIDLLMAWWDSPYMRMFSWIVVDPQGARYTFPTTKFCPYDTHMTDIHTHLMHLSTEHQLDPLILTERKTMRTGVWGILNNIHERDILYAHMDEEKPDLKTLVPQPLPPWHIQEHTQGTHPGIALRRFFSGINHARRHRWWHLFLRWPHIPGEDLVPDIHPLSQEAQLPQYTPEIHIAQVELRRTRSFYDGHTVHLLENTRVGTIDVTSSQRNLPIDMA